MSRRNSGVALELGRGGTKCYIHRWERNQRNVKTRRKKLGCRDE